LKITEVIEKEIKNIDFKADLTEIGEVITIGDGTARIYGLDNVKAGEMVEFSSGLKGLALNLEQDSVGVVVMGDDRRWVLSIYFTKKQIANS
jgi:F-type H+-transporting ATPase subunit alpha